MREAAASDGGCSFARFKGFWYDLQFCGEKMELVLFSSGFLCRMNYTCSLSSARLTLREELCPAALLCAPRAPTTTAACAQSPACERWIFDYRWGRGQTHFLWFSFVRCTKADTGCLWPGLVKLLRTSGECQLPSTHFLPSLQGFLTWLNCTLAHERIGT